jgi:hypothetical protein
MPEPQATMVVRNIKMNSRLLSYFDFVTQPDFKALIVIILFNIYPNLIKNPFSLKLYILSVMILHFSITIAS